MRLIDAGVRDAVTALNRISGVVTRASCEGVGPQRTRHRHGDLAYVLFRYPLPLQLQGFLVEHLDALARIEDDGIYSRWPTHNRAFLDRLAATVHAYGTQHTSDARTQRRWPLPRLRARLARELSQRQPSYIGLCDECRDLVTPPHPSSHHALALLRLGPNQEVQWFGEFIEQSPNALDPALVAKDGCEQLLRRTHHGDFGVAFRRRWLRYRAHKIADLATRQIRRGAEKLRRQRSDIDFFYNDTHAVFVWRRRGSD